MGNASEAIEKIKPRSAQGFDMQTLGKGGAHMTRELNKTIGQEGLGGTIGRGMQTINEGISHNIGEVGKFGHALGRFLTGAGPEQAKQEAQTASANYTGQSQTQRSGSGKRGSGKLTSTDKKKGKGKRSLTIQK